MGFAVWLGISALHNIHPVEVVIAGLLVVLGLLTAWRFYMNLGWIAGPALMIALIVESAKRIFLATKGTGNFGVVDTVIVIAIFFSLLMGIRTARKLRDVGRDAALL